MTEEIQKLISERETSFFARKDIAPLRRQLERLAIPENCKMTLGEIVRVWWERTPEHEAQEAAIRDFAQSLKPWRKGPFALGELLIDSEWVSSKKYALLEPHIDLRDKEVADVGCNNGYYMFRMLEKSPKSLTGFDPSPLYRTQFDFINRFINAPIRFEMLGVEHLEGYGKRFDTIFCLGVLYHRSDPIQMLKSLNKALKVGGELILDTLMIAGSDEVALTPNGRYAKMPNVYFIPTENALRNWLMRANFEGILTLAVSQTTSEEQRKTEWVDSESLEDFLRSSEETIEGYPAPRRIYIKAYKGA